MNKNGNVTPITVFFLTTSFILGWAMFLGSWLNQWGQFMVTNNNLTGMEAFLASNLNLIVLVCLILFIFAYASLSE